MTIIEALRVEHAMFRAMLDHIERHIGELTLVETKRLSSLLERLIHRHGEVEKDMALAALNHALAEKGELQAMQLEHQELDTALQPLQNVNDPAEARRLLQGIFSACRGHFDHEERSIFPLIEKVLPGPVLQELGRGVLHPQIRQA